VIGMEKKIGNIIVSVLEGLAHSGRLKIALLLAENKKLSFSQIVEKSGMEKDEAWISLKFLEEKKVIVGERVIKEVPSRGRPHQTFFTLTREARIIVKFLKLATEEFVFS